MANRIARLDTGMAWAEQGFYVGSREDVMRKEDGAGKIAYRKVVLDLNVLLAKKIGNFV